MAVQHRAFLEVLYRALMMIAKGIKAIYLDGSGVTDSFELGAAGRAPGAAEGKDGGSAGAREAGHGR